MYSTTLSEAVLRGLLLLGPAGGEGTTMLCEGATVLPFDVQLVSLGLATQRDRGGSSEQGALWYNSPLSMLPPPSAENLLPLVAASFGLSILKRRAGCRSTQQGRRVSVGRSASENRPASAQFNPGQVGCWQESMLRPAAFI
jgi:hypothetical protein